MMKQLYYTSCTNTESGRSGFQVKAKSTNITQEEENVLKGMLVYHIPSDVDRYDLANHPIALRYDYLSSTASVLLCSQSNGRDENGRPGNFFAHCVITDPQDFDILAPIMFWRHSFWLTRDSSPRTTIDSAHSFSLEPSLDFEEIWPFLNRGNRRDWFYKLLCAILHSEQTKRPIIILDDIDNVAFWIALATFALPNVYRPLLSFATYHHDPYQASYRITGITRGSSFRVSGDSYTTHFILNAKDNRLSKVKDSDYARYVCDLFDPTNYEEKLLDFFFYCTARLPRPNFNHLGGKLDALTNQYRTLRDRSISYSEPAAVAVVQSFIKEIEVKQDTTLSHEEQQDLETSADLAQKQLLKKPSATTVENYIRVLEALKKYDARFLTRRCKLDLEMGTNLIIAGYSSITPPLFRTFAKVYPEHLLVQIANRPHFLNDLAQKLSTADLEILISVWQQLGSFFDYSQSRKEDLALLVHESLTAMNALPAPGPEPPKDAQQLLAVLHKKIDDYFLLSVSWNAMQNIKDFVLDWVYYEIVGKEPLKEREKYRTYLTKLDRKIEFASLIHMELNRDFLNVDVPNFIRLLTDWFVYQADSPKNQKVIAATSLESMWNKWDTEEKRQATEAIFALPRLRHGIPKDWEKELLAQYMHRLQLQVLDTDDAVTLYQELAKKDSLSTEQSALINGSLVLTDRRFEEHQISLINQLFALLDVDDYQTNTELFFTRFSGRTVPIEEHANMIKAVYLPNSLESFWEIYWKIFKDQLLNTHGSQWLEKLLCFWFEEAQEQFAEYQFLLAGFFIQITGVLEKTKQDKELKSGFSLLSSYIKKHTWYSLLNNQLVAERKRFRIF